ncbi:photosystem II assembly protein [Nostoc sp. TCL26-01]|uniref:photosystem II assembly protein n=1 Tax=Nostoc sp. TCL26-01 TaxID=2576904 RepID=UPI0015B9C662|nr:photosystem II assembly protein [Nostoc sp. TCL26-01]QLE56285.1 photosystem II assembly protein [Nostoc sp. TCL26-01]
MSNPIVNWWRSQQFKLAVSRGDTQKAVQILHDIQKSGARFSWLEKLFRDKLQLERASLEYKREIGNLTEKLTQLSDSAVDNCKLYPNQELINSIYQKFQLIQHDHYLIQSTGIDVEIFDDFESKLVAYLQDEFNKIPVDKLNIKLADAFEDIHNLKIGQDPDYNFSLTPHVYFMKFFLENVYCLYLAWFFIYQDGLLSNKLNILDIAAGPGTVAYSLALFLKSIGESEKSSQDHISYYSLEKQDGFQFRGLQFWRKYIESLITPVNTYFRFVTADLLSSNHEFDNLPQDFFDFIVISHCFFADTSARNQANSVYKSIFTNNLKKQGYVLLIIQDKKLFKFYKTKQEENQDLEKKLVASFIAELGLDLVWYKYLTSRDSRKPCSAMEFAKFAEEKLPKQIYMTPMIQKYSHQKHDANYTLDDYIILAKK